MRKLKSLSVFGSRTFMYRFFSLFPQWKQYKTDRMKDFTRIVKEYHKDMIQEACNNRYGVEFPSALGKLVICSFKSRYPYPAFKHAGDKAPAQFSNIETGGLRCRLMYFNYENKYKLKDKLFWEFKPEVPFKKMVSKAFKEDYKKYIFNPDKTERFLRKIDFENKVWNDSKVERFLENYDEFELN